MYYSLIIDKKTINSKENLVRHLYDKYYYIIININERDALSYYKKYENNIIIYEDTKDINNKKDQKIYIESNLFHLSGYYIADLSKIDIINDNYLTRPINKNSLSSLDSFFFSNENNYEAIDNFYSNYRNIDRNKINKIFYKIDLNKIDKISYNNFKQLFKFLFFWVGEYGDTILDIKENDNYWIIEYRL